MPHGKHDSGFTLIETLVALVIFVACYLLIHESLSLGWKGVRMAHTETIALHIAQTRLAAEGVEAPLVEGQRSETTADGFAWTIDVWRHTADVGEGVRPALTGYWVTVEVKWHDAQLRRSRFMQLTTFKLASTP